MKTINNNSVYNQPNFGSLKSIKTGGKFNIETYPEKVIDVMKAFRESDAIKKFCEKYDVDASFYAFDRSSNDFLADTRAFATMSLKTKYINPDGKETYPDIVYTEYPYRKDNVSSKTAFSKLTKKIKELKFKDLEYRLLAQVKVLKEKNQSRNYKEEYNEIMNSLLSKDSISPQKADTITPDTNKNKFKKLIAGVKNFFKGEL